MSHHPAAARARRSLSRLLCALSGFSAGLLNGLLGAAGGILLVAVLPALPLPTSLLPDGLLDRWEKRDVLATALSVMLPVSAFSLLLYGMDGHLPSLPVLLSLLLPATLGGFLGARLLGRLSDRFIKKLFAAVVVVAGARMLF
jgi:uncharacterized membrane protein YfcA